MKEKIIDTIIIGAGISGLGCANQLQKHKKNFLVITEDIGGRIITSTNGKVNYGAYFVLDNYYHILKYVEKGQKLHPFKVDFHNKGKSNYHLLKMAQYPFEAIKLLFLLHKFKSAYESFKKSCEQISQKETIENNPYLKDLYFQSASDFAKKNNISKIANKFLVEGVYMCTFMPLTLVSAFDFMRLCLGLIKPAYEFNFKMEKLIKNYADKIVIDSVIKIKKTNNYEIHTKSGKTYLAKHIVLATPPHISKQLVNLKKTKKPSNAYMFHIKGELNANWNKGQFELFNSNSSIIFIRKQTDNTYVFYSKTKNPPLNTYFNQWNVIFRKDWKPAFNLTGNTLIGSKYDKNLYLIGDHNVIGLEDSYITGLYAANKICKST